MAAAAAATVAASAIFRVTRAIYSRDTRWSVLSSVLRVLMSWDTAYSVVVDLKASVVGDIQLSNWQSENTLFCGQNACSFWNLLSSKGILWQQHLAGEPLSEGRWPSKVETKARRKERGDATVSGATEVKLMVWQPERTNVWFTAVFSHFIQKSSTGAVPDGGRKILVFHYNAKAIIPFIKQ